VAAQWDDVDRFSHGTFKYSRTPLEDPFNLTIFI